MLPAVIAPICCEKAPAPGVMCITCKKQACIGYWLGDLTEDDFDAFGNLKEQAD